MIEKKLSSYLEFKSSGNMRGYKLISKTGLSVICRCPRLVYFKENGKAQKTLQPQGGGIVWTGSKFGNITVSSSSNGLAEYKLNDWKKHFLRQLQTAFNHMTLNLEIYKLLKPLPTTTAVPEISFPCPFPASMNLLHCTFSRQLRPGHSLSTANLKFIVFYCHNSFWTFSSLKSCIS